MLHWPPIAWPLPFLLFAVFETSVSFPRVLLVGLGPARLGVNRKPGFVVIVSKRGGRLGLDRLGVSFKPVSCLVATGCS